MRPSTSSERQPEPTGAEAKDTDIEGAPTEVTIADLMAGATTSVERISRAAVQIRVHAHTLLSHYLHTNYFDVLDRIRVRLL